MTADEPRSLPVPTRREVAVPGAGETTAAPAPGGPAQAVADACRRAGIAATVGDGILYVATPAGRVVGGESGGPSYRQPGPWLHVRFAARPDCTRFRALTAPADGRSWLHMVEHGVPTITGDAWWVDLPASVAGAVIERLGGAR